MAHNPKTAVARRNAMIDNYTGNLNSGFVKIYTGTQPTDADTAIGAQVLLATLTFGSTAFGAASSGSASANAITSGTAGNTGTATWFRLFKSDNSTAVSDGSVTTVADGTGDMLINSTAISSGATVACSSFTITQAA